MSDEQTLLNKVIYDGLNVKEEREKRGMSQAELSQLSGVQQTVLSRIENGHVSPRAKTLFAIRQALGDTANTLDTLIEFEEILTGKTQLYDRKYFELYPAEHVGYMACCQDRNAPYLMTGDMLYFDKDKMLCTADKCQCNQPVDPSRCSMGGFYLFKFEHGYATASVQNSLTEKDKVYLSFLNSNYPDLGWFNISDLHCIGKLIRIGRNADVLNSHVFNY